MKLYRVRKKENLVSRAAMTAHLSLFSFQRTFYIELRSSLVYVQPFSHPLRHRLSRGRVLVRAY
jgi:hypothetical protein